MDNPGIYATGNEMISLPEIREADGSILSMTLLYMRYKGMISLTGNEETPLFKPFLELDGRRQGLENLEWSRVCHWIPAFLSTADDLEVSGTILTPIGERGFIYEFTVRNLSNRDMNIAMGLEGLPGVVSSAGGGGLCVSRDVDVAYFADGANGHHEPGLSVFGGGDFFGEPDGVVGGDLPAGGECDVAAAVSVVVGGGVGDFP
jgi:hypothetical protein